MPHALKITVLACAAVLTAPAADNQLTAQEKAAGWRLLFDGKTYAGWEDPAKKSPPGNGFTIEDGCIKSLPHPKIDEDLFTLRYLPRFRTGVRLEDLAGRQQRREVSHTGSRLAG